MAAVLVGASGVAIPAAAREPAYAGKWAAQPVQCRVGQDTQRAPMIVTRNGYDQHEAHCQFASVRAGAVGTWRVRARCSVEGDTQNHELTLTVAGDRLSVRDAHGARTLRRCR